MIMLKAQRGSIEPITIFIAWVAIFLKITGPKNILWMPDPFKLYDILTLLLLVVIIIGLWKRPKIETAGNPLILKIAFLYIGLVLFIPIVGIFIYGEGLQYYYGDLRWVSVILIGFSLFWAYKTIPVYFFSKHLYMLIWILLAFQTVFVIEQLIFVYQGALPFGLLEIYYPKGVGGYGKYGVHINRYSGAMLLSSQLALMSAIATIFSILIWFKNGNWKDFTLTIISGLLLIATGSRTAIFSVLLICLVVGLTIVSVRLFITKRSLTIFGAALLGLGVILSTSVYLNLGRIGSFDRYEEVLDIATGEKSLSGVSNRGSAIWAQPLHTAYTEYSPIGTLINPSHAVDLVDSYYVFLMAQAGPIILIAFIIMLLGIILKSIKEISRREIDCENHRLFAFALATSLCFLLLATTQNLMTGMPARVFLMLAILCICLKRKNRISHKTI